MPKTVLMKIANHVFLALFLVLPFLKCSPQCCTPGSPSAGTVNQSTLPKSALRFVSYYQFSTGNHFYSGSHKKNYNYIEGARFHFGGVNLAYGISKKLTAEADLGYYFKRSILYNSIGSEYNPYNSASGLADFMLQVKYAAYKNLAKEWEITPMLGVRIPSALTPVEKNGEPLLLDLQPSTQSFGLSGGFFVYKGLPNHKTRLFASSKLIYSFANRQKYQFGISVSSAFFASHSLNHRVTLIAQLRNEWRQQDARKGLLRSATGANILLLSPQLTYSFAKQWNLSAQVEVPVYQHYNGTQLGRTLNTAIVVNKLFKKR